MSRIMWFCNLYAHQVIVCTRNLNPQCYALVKVNVDTNFPDQNGQTPTQASLAFYCQLTLFLHGSFDLSSISTIADNVIAFRCPSVIYPHLLLSPSHFRNSLFMFSIERVNGIPLWDFYQSDFQGALKIIIIAETFIVMTISSG